MPQQPDLSTMDTKLIRTMINLFVNNALILVLRIYALCVRSTSINSPDVVVVMRNVKQPNPAL